MTVAPPRTSQRETRETFDSLDPATGAVLATYPVHGEAEVRAAVTQARRAAAWWADLGFDGRKERLKAWNVILAERGQELARLISRENGKPVGDALLEVVLVVDHLAWAAGKAASVLGPRRRPAGILVPNHEATVEYLPLGVVGVIGPWNYPLFTPMGSIAYALAAGNAVVFKPSEYTPGVARWLADTFAEAVPEAPVLQVVTGRGETGAALCRAGVDKLAFTGSAATGRKVMAACAETLTPVLLELGGKDVLIVDDDADVAQAADMALWSGMSNAGQTCIGTERVYVTERNFERFLAELRTRAARLQPGVSYGPITMPSQIDVIRRHIDDALDRGATAVVGGRESVRPPYVDPVVLVDVPDDAPANVEETFGPTLTVTMVRDADEAVERANATSYGLAGAVFGKARAMDIARRLRSGMTSVNGVAVFASAPELPFGGVGHSGFGRIHGEDGLKEFTRAKAITRQRFRSPIPITSFDRPEKALSVVLAMLRLRVRRG